MSDKPSINKDEDELGRLWREQKLKGDKMPLDEIRQKAEKFESRVRRRNLREYIAGVIVVVTFGAMVFRAPNTLGRLGAGLIVVAAIYIIYSLRIRGSAQNIPEDAARMSFIQFHRRSLERQRDL